MAVALTSPIKSNTAQVKVRRDKAHALRNRAQLVDEGDEWSTLEIDYSEESELVSDVLWHGDDAVIITPESARYAAMKALNEIVKSHG
jgi:proteasome accessory factor B